jgi:hypothetical protein
MPDVAAGSIHGMQILPECDDHCDAHDPVGKCCPPTECQPEISERISNHSGHTALLWAV